MLKGQINKIKDRHEIRRKESVNDIICDDIKKSAVNNMYWGAMYTFGYMGAIALLTKLDERRSR